MKQKRKHGLKNILAVGGNTTNEEEFNLSTEITEGQLVTNYSLNYMKDFESTKIWAKNGDLELSKKKILLKKSIKVLVLFIFQDMQTQDSGVLTHIKIIKGG